MTASQKKKEKRRKQKEEERRRSLLLQSDATADAETSPLDSKILSSLKQSLWEAAPCSLPKSCPLLLPKSCPLLLPEELPPAPTEELPPAPADNVPVSERVAAEESTHITHPVVQDPHPELPIQTSQPVGAEEAEKPRAELEESNPAEVLADAPVEKGNMPQEPPAAQDPEQAEETGTSKSKKKKNKKKKSKSVDEESQVEVGKGHEQTDPPTEHTQPPTPPETGDSFARLEQPQELEVPATGESLEEAPGDQTVKEPPPEQVSESQDVFGQESTNTAADTQATETPLAKEGPDEVIEEVQPEIPSQEPTESRVEDVVPETTNTEETKLKEAPTEEQFTIVEASAEPEPGPETKLTAKQLKKLKKKQQKALTMDATSSSPAETGKDTASEATPELFLTEEPDTEKSVDVALPAEEMTTTRDVTTTQPETTHPEPQESLDQGNTELEAPADNQPTVDLEAEKEPNALDTAKPAPELEKPMTAAQRRKEKKKAKKRESQTTDKDSTEINVEPPRQ
ncbi:hypothetical protein N7470_001438 [Penicillium chermesinum]|nr:hypothetical protein N7470_001438 [Penicillium chermesinum]